MPLRTFLILLVLVCGVTGCRSGGWGWNPSSKPAPEPPIENFSNSQLDSKEKASESEMPVGSFSLTNGRSDDPGTGLSSRSREIERNLGYH